MDGWVAVSRGAPLPLPTEAHVRDEAEVLGHIDNDVALVARRRRPGAAARIGRAAGEVHPGQKCTVVNEPLGKGCGGAVGGLGGGGGGGSGGLLDVPGRTSTSPSQYSRHDLRTGLRIWLQ